MKLPLDKVVKANGHSPQYRIHKYFARRPYNVFQNFIEHYTNENDIVLDVFCGGGVTIFESAALNRRAIGVDLNPLATFITEMQLKQVNIAYLQALFKDFIDDLSDLEELYSYTYQGKKYKIEWLEWTYQVLCPKCNSTIALTEDNKAVNASGKARNGYYICPNKHCSNNDSQVGVKRIDCKPYSSIPLRVKLDAPGGLVIELSKEEANRLKNINYSFLINEGMIVPDESVPLNWDRMQEDKLLEKGISNFSDLFTERNFCVNVVIFNKIIALKERYGEDLVDCLYFAFSSSLRYTNKMSRVSDNWENGNPTSMDKHAYWLPNVYVETNVIKKLSDRMRAVVKGLTFTQDKIDPEIKLLTWDKLLSEKKGYSILCQSSSELPLPDKSVHAVITDPPYGSNVQYSELSSFWNVWLKYYKGMGNFIFNKEEAVMNRRKNIQGFKNLQHYEDVLFSVFSECHRVLKDDGYLVFTFNNKNLKVWVALLTATIKAGFIIPEGGIIFQDFIDSYKNTSHLKYSGNIHGDFVYSFVKGEYSIDPELINQDPLQYITIYVNKVIDEMYQLNNSYSTTKLYENIFNGLIHVLGGLIASNIDEVEMKFEEISKQSDNFIDNILKDRLIQIEGEWIREGVDGC